MTRVKEGPAFTSNGTVGVAFDVRSFSLNECVQNSEFLKLFGQYRIKAVDLHCIPNVNACQTSDPSKYSIFHYAIDPVNASAFTTMDDVHQMGNVKRINVQDTKDFHIRIKPQTQAPVFAGSVSASSYEVNKAGQWLTTAGTGPQTIHYGLRWAWQASYTTSITVYVKYYFEFKGLQ